MGVRGRCQLVVLLAFVVSGVFGPISSPAVHAQPGATSYTSALTGQAIQTSGPWSIDTESIVSDGTSELITIMGQYDGVIVAFLPPGTDLVYARDIFLAEFGAAFETFVPIDRGNYGSVSYSLDLTSSEGFEFGAFSLFLGEQESGYVEYYLYFGPVLYFQSGMNSAKAQITVGGEPIFDGVEPAGLQELLAQNAGATGAPAPTEAAPAPTVAVPSTVAAPGPTEAAPAPDDTSATSDAEWAHAAVIRSELDYLQGTIDAFVVNFAQLTGESSSTAADEINTIAGEWVAYSDRAAGIVAPPGAERIDGPYRVLVRDIGTLAGDWYAVVDALRNGDDAVVDTAIESFAGSLNTVQDGIGDLGVLLDEIEGGTGDIEGSETATEESGGGGDTQSQPLETPEPDDAEVDAGPLGNDRDSDTGSDLDPADDRNSRRLPPVGVTPEATNESETGRGGQGGTGAVDLPELEDLGLVNDGTYVSPQFHTEIVWDTTWELYTLGEDAPIISDLEQGTDGLVLTWDGEDFLLLYVDLFASDNLTPADFVDYWQTDEYLAENADADAEILLADSDRSAGAVLVRDYLSSGEEVVILHEAISLDSGDTIALVTLIGMPDAFADAYADAEADVLVDGDSVVLTFSPREIRRAVS